MKNAILTGIFIGALSILWMFTMHGLGFHPQKGSMSPIEFVSILIPLTGLYFGIRNYRKADCGGNMGFLQALVQAFKILITGGVITVAGSIIYVNIFSKGASLMDFSGRIFGALLMGLLFALGIAVLLTTKPNKVD